MRPEPAPTTSPPFEPMRDDIRRQATFLARLLQRTPEIEAFAAANLRPGQGGRAYAFGSGDGWFAARAASGAGRRLEAPSGLDFVLNVAPRLGPADRALAISMSGNVDRTFEGAKLALERGARVSLLTNGEGGRVGGLGVPVLSLDMPDIAPFLCGTSSYAATLAVLELCFGGDAAAGALRAVAPELETLIERADGFAAACAEELGARPGVRFLGAGRSVATADYGAAKFVEVTAIRAWSDDIEEFAHRQFWSMGTEEIVVLLPTERESARYADATADALSDLDVPTIALEPGDAPVPAARFRLALPGDAATAGLTQAAALQLLAYHFGLASGTNPNTRAHLKNDAARFAVSRKLTRRSLLGTGR